MGYGVEALPKRCRYARVEVSEGEPNDLSRGQRRKERACKMESEWWTKLHLCSNSSHELVRC